MNDTRALDALQKLLDKLPHLMVHVIGNLLASGVIQEGRTDD